MVELFPDMREQTYRIGVMDMNKKTIWALTMTAVLLTMTGCSRKSSSSSNEIQRSAADSQTTEQETTQLDEQPDEQQDETSAHEQVFDNYIKAFYTDKDAETVMNYSVPQSVISALKDNGSFDSALGGFDTKINSQFHAYGDAPDYKGVLSISELDPAAYPAAADYLKSYCADTDVAVNVSSGYEFKYSIDYQSPNGSTSNNECSACVVGVDGDGWKVIDGMDGDILQLLYNSK